MCWEKGRFEVSVISFRDQRMGLFLPLEVLCEDLPLNSPWPWKKRDRRICRLEFSGQAKIWHQLHLKYLILNTQTRQSPSTVSPTGGNDGGVQGFLFCYALTIVEIFNSFSYKENPLANLKAKSVSTPMFSLLCFSYSFICRLVIMRLLLILIFLKPYITLKHCRYCMDFGTR